jgi:hypothetical protein
MGNIDKSHSHWSPSMKPHTIFSPVSLRYIAALRSNKSKKAGQPFTYAQAFCHLPEELICLAASNPEGRFYGLVTDDAARRSAEEMAAQRGTFNVIFLAGTPSQILARLANGSALPPMLDFLCCDENAQALDGAERTALFDLAQNRLNPGGLFVRSYRAYSDELASLRFLVRELAPEMSDAQKLEFLTDIKKLGGAHLNKHGDLAKKLDAAIAAKAPQDFFALLANGDAKSATFDTMVDMGKRGLSYAGDARMASNYVELAIAPAAQDLIVSCRTNPLYEPIKDFALGRTIRVDIWSKTGGERSTDVATLFGGFAYGILTPRDHVPLSFAAQGKLIDLSGPLYTKLIDIMAVMPVGVGDVLAQENTKGEDPAKILEALQIMVAVGIAHPMRGTLTATNTGSIAQPRLVGSFNRYLDKTDLSDKEVWFASQVMGCGVTLPASEAFVMQALNRAGLNNSVSALMPELRRIANTSVGLSIIHEAEPTAEIAHAMVTEIVGKSLPQWYAYALLEAA